MSALQDYISELKRRAFWLGRADSIDCATLSPNSLRSQRRHYTRRDSKRLDYECEVDWLESHFDAHSLLEQIEAERAIPCPYDKEGTWTRVSWFLRKYRRVSIRGFHARALAESQQNGTYQVIAPLLERMLRLHERLVESYTNTGELDSEELDRKHDRAIERLSLYVPADVGGGGGDEWSCYLTKARAASLHNGQRVENATAYFNALIESGKLTAPRGSGQKWQFIVSEFPANTRETLRGKLAQSSAT